jgi:hypothetical protein
MAGECEKSNRGYNNNLQSDGKLYIEMKKCTSLNLDVRPDLIPSNNQMNLREETKVKQGCADAVGITCQLLLFSEISDG